MKYISKEDNTGGSNGSEIITNASNNVSNDDSITVEQTQTKDNSREEGDVNFVNNSTNECILCKFKFKCKYDFIRHTHSNKHKQKLSNVTICRICFKQFSTKFNKSRHEKKCSNNTQ